MTSRVTTRETMLYVEGLCCAEEEQLIRKKLGGVTGVDAMQFNLLSRKITVWHTCSLDDITVALRNIGFTPRLRMGVEEPSSFLQKHGHFILTSASGVFLVAGMLLNHFQAAADSILIPIFLFSIASGGWRTAVKGFTAAKHLIPDMNVLMSIAVIGAGAIGKWEEAAAVIFLFSLSQLLEQFTMERSRRAIRSLMNLSPAMATVKRGSSEYAVRVEEISVGEHVVIRPGERLPLDGTIVSGESSVNQAPITGESLPVSKRAGDEVFAGSMNERGTLDVCVTREFYDTTLARIVQKVEEAQAERAPVQNIADRFAMVYSPAVIVLAALVAAAGPVITHEPFGFWFYRALVLLVIACPCALVISTPVTIISGLSNAAGCGVLMKGGRHLEAIGKLKGIAFDKTGTLTAGMPRVTDVISLNSLTPDRIIGLAAAIESRSEHHLAGAVVRKAQEEGVTSDTLACREFESLTGRGVSATIDNVTYLVGSHELIEEKKICSPRVEEILGRLEAEGKTTLILCSEKEPLGIIAVADEVRAESRRLIEDLFREGVQKVIMLTGDNVGTARSVAARAGIQEFYAGVLPEEKVQHVLKLREQYGTVAIDRK